MAIVKLHAERTRGDRTFGPGEVYECSDAEAAALIENGYAAATDVPPPQAPEPEPELAPEPEPEPTPKPAPKRARAKAS